MSCGIGGCFGHAISSSLPPRSTSMASYFPSRFSKMICGMPSRGVALFQPLHQLFLPRRRAARLHSEQFGAAEEEVAVDVPGEAHAAMRLDVFFGAQIVGVACRGA